MTAPLQADYKALSAEAFLIAWLKPLVTGSAASTSIGSKRWAVTSPTMPLPYRTVHRVTGPRDSDGDYPTIWVDTLAGTYTAAAQEADRTDARFQVLVDNPTWGITLPDGRVAHCDWAEITAAAHEEAYGAETVVTRFVSEYRLCISLVPTA